MSSNHPNRAARPRVLAAAIFTVAMILAGCSSDSDDSPTSTEPPTDQSTAPSTDDAPDDTATESTSDTSSDEGPTDEGSSDDIVASPPEKSWQDALDAARDEFDGGVSKIELERQDRGGMEYKIELISSDTKFEIQFDADTLEVLSQKKDDLGDDAEKKQARIFDPADAIDLDEAADIARGEVDGVIEEWKLEGKDDGRVQYEFDIVPDGETDDIEVEIDALTGRVLEVD